MSEDHQGIDDECSDLDVSDADLNAEDISEAMQTLSQHLQNDPSYAWSWQCNLAMQLYDRSRHDPAAGGELTREAANRLAASQLLACFDVDITKNPNWQF